MNNFLNRPRSRQDAHERRLGRMMRAALFRRSCPDTMTLSDYQLGLLSSAAHARVHAHVARCPHCQAELARLDDFLADRSAAPGWIRDVGFEWQRLARMGSRVGKIVIRLVEDALPPSFRPLPVRGELAGTDGVVEPETHRHIALRLEQTNSLDVQVEVRQSATVPDAWQVDVEALVPDRWPDLSGTRVKVRAGTWSREIVTDEYGRAIVDGVPRVQHDFSITIEIDPGESSVTQESDISASSSDGAGELT